MTDLPALRGQKYGRKSWLSRVVSWACYGFWFSYRGCTSMVSESSPPRRIWIVGSLLGGLIFGITATVGALIDWAPWTPPMAVHSLAVVVEDGVPVRVVEHRTTGRAFDGDWAVRVVRVSDGAPEIICARPPDARGYKARYSTIGESFLSLPFDEYIGDPSGECRERMAAGNHVIVTERHDITAGIREALPLASSPTFEVVR